MRHTSRRWRLLGMLTVAYLLWQVDVAWPAREPLEIHVENAADPFSRPDGTGYANDVVRAAFESVGVRVKFTVVPYARCKYKVLSGAAAVCVSMSWDPSFEGTDQVCRYPADHGDSGLLRKPCAAADGQE